MNMDQASSTSSELTDLSRPWPEIVALGDEIVRRLGLETSVDTLGRWIAHRIAELMERDDEKSRAEVAHLILRCWEQRRSWTSGWPREALAEAFLWADRNAPPSHGRPRRGVRDAWARQLTVGLDLTDQMRGVWMSFAMAEEDDGLDLEEFNPGLFFEDELDESERQLLMAVAEMKRKSRALFAELGDDARSEDRARVARERLTALHTEQVTAFETLVSELAAAKRPSAARKRRPTEETEASPPKTASPSAKVAAKKARRAPTRQSATASKLPAAKKASKARS